MIQKIGVDKIELTTKEYSIKNLKSNQFAIDTTIKQGVGSPSQTWVDECGNLVNAWKIYHNGIGNYSINDFGLKISLKTNMQRFYRHLNDCRHKIF